MQKKGEKTDFVKWFSEMNKDSGKLVGGKGANLSEIFNLGVAVPPGFVVTAQAYDYFIKKSKLNEKIKALLENLNYEDTTKLNSVTEMEPLSWESVQNIHPYQEVRPEGYKEMIGILGNRLKDIIT